MDRYLVTFYKESSDKPSIIEHQIMNADEVMELYEAMLSAERLSEPVITKPSKLFEVNKLEPVTDNS